MPATRRCGEETAVAETAILTRRIPVPSGTCRELMRELSDNTEMILRLALVMANAESTASSVSFYH